MESTDPILPSTALSVGWFRSNPTQDWTALWCRVSVESFGPILGNIGPLSFWNVSLSVDDVSITFYTCPDGFSEIRPPLTMFGRIFINRTGPLWLLTVWRIFRHLICRRLLAWMCWSLAVSSSTVEICWNTFINLHLKNTVHSRCSKSVCFNETTSHRAQLFFLQTDSVVGSCSRPRKELTEKESRLATEETLASSSGIMPHASMHLGTKSKQAYV